MSQLHRAILVTLVLATACTPAATATLTPTVTRVPTIPHPTPTEAQTRTNAVSVHLSETSTTRVLAEIEAGTAAEMVVSFKPVKYMVTRRDDGSVSGTSSQTWDPHDVTEMRICTALEDPCQLSDQWVPFPSEQRFQIDVDWLGPKEFWVTAQFRDASGDIVPSFGDEYEETQATSKASYSVVGILKETTPVEGLPAPVQTAAAATRTAFPVHGSVAIEDGRCCVGGTEGETIQIEVAFEAASPWAEITEMRTRSAGRCFSEDELADAQWEPFTSSKTYPVYVTINWVGFYVSVQYRDAQGNVSPAFCDDIAVEGHPAPPSPQPNL